jgi:hypothetical protein
MLTAILPVVLVIVVVVAAIMFSRSGGALRELGGGRWAIDREDRGEGSEDRAGESPAETRAEVRQMVEAKDYRLRRRGEDGIDVDAEVTRLTAVEEGPGGSVEAWTVEIRQLVIANNERRRRRGDPPLDVEAEVARRLSEWT